jgi:aryl-alcohol dehydrogenase-like predicted oxidoreductase
MTLRPEPYEHLLNERTFNALSALAEASRARGVEMGTLAMAWVLRHPLMTAAIVGPRNPAHLDSALAALDVTMSADDAAQLGALFSGGTAPGHP